MPRRATRTSSPSARMSPTRRCAARNRTPYCACAQARMAPSASRDASRAAGGTANTAPSPPNTKGRSAAETTPMRKAAMALTCAQITAAPIVFTSR